MLLSIGEINAVIEVISFYFKLREKEEQENQIHKRYISKILLIKKAKRIVNCNCNKIYHGQHSQWYNSRALNIDNHTQVKKITQGKGPLIKPFYLNFRQDKYSFIKLTITD